LVAPALLIAVAVGAGISPSLAGAAQSHAFSTTFGSPGSGAGEVSLLPMEQSVEGGVTVWKSPGSGLAVNTETGDLYVADTENHRIDQFSSTGTFIRAFGWEVDAEHPEAKLQECTAATGCQAGSSGSGAGQLPRAIYLAVDNDPSSPSQGDVYVSTGKGTAGENEVQQLEVTNATGGTFTLTFEAQTTEPIPYNATHRVIEVALERLSTIGPGNVFVSGGAANARIFFRRGLAEDNLPLITATGAALSGSGPTAEVSPRADGATFVPEAVAKFGAGGELIESWGNSGELAGTPSLATGTGHLVQGAAIGTGHLTSGSNTITAVSAESGAFEVGQGIEGEGVPFNDYITAVGAGTLTLAAPAEITNSVALTTNTAFVTNLSTNSGAFELGQRISGAGIPAGTRIEKVQPGVLVLSKNTTAAGNAVPLSATRPFDTGFFFDGIAVDASGNLVVPTGRDSDFLRFDQSGAYAGKVAVTGPKDPAATPAGLAIDGEGSFYFARVGQEAAKVSPTGQFAGVLYHTPKFNQGSQDLSSITSLAISPATGDLYLDEGSSVVDISSQCEPTPIIGCVASQQFGEGHLSGAAGLALAADGTLYAADTEAGEIAVFTVSLEANIQAATEVGGRSALLHGTVNPKGGEVTTCRFQYGASKAYGRSLPCLNGAGEEVGTPSDPLTGTSAIALHAPLEGLKAGTTYHFRLRAVDTGGEEIHSEDEELETLVLPLVEAEEATEVTASSATLKAKVNPQGLAVSSCQIEWGTSSAYGQSLPCEPSSLPAGTVAVPIGAALSSLSSGTTYHWRVTATNSDGSESSPDNTFVFLPGPSSGEVSQECANEALREANGSTALPDCRAYEIVTPPVKNGALIAPYAFSIQYALSADGSRLISNTTQCFGASTSCGVLRQTVGAAFEFTRGPGGWSPAQLGPPVSLLTGATLLGDSADAGSALYLGVPATPPSGGREWLYARAADGSFTPIGPVAEEPGFRASEIGSGVSLASVDVSHVLYSLLPFVGWPSFDSGSNASSLYEYAGAAEHPFLVGVSGGLGSTDLISTCGTDPGAGSHAFSTALALAADGRTVYVTVPRCATGSGANAGVPVPARTIYARIDGERAETAGEAGARTVKISGPAPEPACDAACQAQPPADAEFAGASTDGSRVYFLSTQQLTNEASVDKVSGDSAALGGCSHTTGKGACNLYLYSDPQEEPGPTGNHLTDVSAGDSSGQGPQVQGVMAISPDGSRVYFVAKGLLTGANAEGVEPEEGAPNLYCFEAEDEVTRFVATLSANPTFGSQNPFVGSFGSDSGQWAAGIGEANVSAEGRYLLFASHRSLTLDASGGEGPAQIYRYDALEESLTRVSIGQRGFNDNGNRGKADALIVPAVQSLLSRLGPATASPSLSADGRRAFFESPVALAPGALDEVPIDNRGALAENVYEWEEQGVEGCQQGAGCLYVISDGRDASESTKGGLGRTRSGVELLGASQSGKDVFFSTSDPLVPTDTDTESDVYVARSLGGFPPPSQAVPCESSEACHGEGTREGSVSAPATPGFTGPEEGRGHPEKPKRKKHRHRKHRHRKHHRPTKHRQGRSGDRNQGGSR
jgi:hypothetical protein